MVAPVYEGKRQVSMRSSGIRSKNRSSLELDLINRSPGTCDTPKNVVIVMDPLKDFSTEPLEWVLQNIILMACCTITLVGVTPWLNIPLSQKKSSDIWAMDEEDLSAATENPEWRSDTKHLKVQRLLDICQRYGVVPHIRTQMGFPTRHVVVEQVATLHATLVVFDRRHDKKDVEYIAKTIPCNIVKMNHDGEVDFMIKGRSSIDTEEETPTESWLSVLPSPRLMVAEHVLQILKQKFNQIAR